MGIGYLIFGNVDSRDYDIEVFFKDVDRTPKRVYKSIEVPGRNGAVLIDENRYEDVPFSYDCVALDDTYRKAFVNALASQIGYKRMQDSFNEGEFYSAVFDGDVEPNVTSDRAKSTFTIYFTRASQRFLTSGEEVIDVDSGDTITNPTLFESSPLLEVEGYGTIAFNGYEITINDVVIGEIETSTRSSQNIDKMTQQSVSKTYQKVINYSSQAGALESGDKLFISSLKVTQKARYFGSGLAPSPTVSGNISGVTASGSVRNYSEVEGGSTYNYASYTTAISVGNIELTAFTDESYSSTITSVLKASNNATNGAVTIRINITNTASGILTIQVVCSGTNSGLGDIYDSGGSIEYGRTYLYSTRSILGSPLYVDCDLGEAYKYEGETLVSINQHVDLGSDLPKLGSGANTITADNTVTDLKVVPRWWKV